MTLYNNNAVLTDLSHLILYHIPQLARLDVFLLFFSVLNVLTHMTTMLCWVTLTRKYETIALLHKECLIMTVSRSLYMYAS